MISGSDAHGEVWPLELRGVVLLVGFMGAGKSSVGRALGLRLGWAFHDLDERIATREQRSIEQIFMTSGEAGFRRAEHAALRELFSNLASSPAVVALGGGTFAQPENQELIVKSQARTIFLDAEVEELLRRCRAEGNTRPLLRDGMQFRRLYESRRASYLGASLHIETGGKDVDTVVAEIERRLKLDSSD